MAKEYNMSAYLEMIHEILDEVEENEEKFANFKPDFILSLQSQIDDGRKLSKKQISALERLYDMIMDGGWTV